MAIAQSARADEPRPLRVTPAQLDPGAPAAVALDPEWAAGSLDATPGTIDSIERDDHGLRARYLPAAPPIPGAALLRVRAADCHARYAVVRFAGRAVIHIRTKPLATVKVEIRERKYGPVIADAGGHVAVPVRVEIDDVSYRATSIDRLGNENRTEVPLPPSPALPAVLAMACAERVHAGQSFEVEAAAIDPAGRPLHVALRLPEGATSTAAPSEVGELAERFVIAIPSSMPQGPLLVEARAGAGSAVVSIQVTPPIPVVESAVVRAAPLITSAVVAPAPSVDRRPRWIAIADAGLASNFGAALGPAASLAIEYRLRWQDRRFAPRLALSLQELRSTLATAAALVDGAVSVETLAIPLEAGLGVTWLRRGRLDLSLEVMGGVAWVRQRAQGGTVALSEQELAGSLGGAVAARLAIGRVGLIARAGYRYLVLPASSAAGAIRGDDSTLLVTIGATAGVR